MTLVACALLGLEAVPNLLFGLSFFSGAGVAPFLPGVAVGLVAGALPGAALLRQGGFSVPASGEKGATGAALVGLALGAAAVLLLGAPAFGMPAFCSLVGLAAGRASDRSAVNRGT